MEWESSPCHYWLSHCSSPWQHWAATGWTPGSSHRPRIEIDCSIWINVNMNISLLYLFVQHQQWPYHTLLWLSVWTEDWSPLSSSFIFSVSVYSKLASWLAALQQSTELTKFIVIFLQGCYAVVLWNTKYSLTFSKIHSVITNIQVGSKGLYLWKCCLVPHISDVEPQDQENEQVGCQQDVDVDSNGLLLPWIRSLSSAWLPFLRNVNLAGNVVVGQAIGGLW